MIGFDYLCSARFAERSTSEVCSSGGWGRGGPTRLNPPLVGWIFGGHALRMRHK